MKSLRIVSGLFAVALAVSSGAAVAQTQTRDQTLDQTREQTRDRIRDREIYGYQLMTPQERNQYRARMRAAKTNEERVRIRSGHHALMQERAKERGVKLPSEPPPGRGPGMGPGRGPGGGGSSGK